jgi:FAD/FMN-containing dehydrogenase
MQLERSTSSMMHLSVNTMRRMSILAATVVCRGGGMSYTGGYVPAEENSVLIDPENRINPGNLGL